MPVPFDQYDPQWIIQEFKAGDIRVPPVQNKIVQLSQLPTHDTHVVGQVWNSTGTPLVSAG